LKIDFHVHTKYSRDCMSEPKAIAKKAQGLGIIPSITDHDSIGAHRDFIDLAAPFLAGEEISTDKGDLIGLFLTEEIPGKTQNPKHKTPFLDVLDLIHGQGGLAYLPHMFDVTRSGVSGPELAKKADIIEIFNARSVMKDFNLKAEKFAKANSIPGAAGSDSHFLSEFGSTYTELPEFDLDDPKELMRALKSANARIVGRSAPLYVKGTTTVVKIWKKMTKKNF